MESSFRAYRKLHLSRSWLSATGIGLYLSSTYTYTQKVGRLWDTQHGRRPFAAEDKYFLILARVEMHVAAIVGLVKLSG